MERLFWICLAGAAGTAARYLVALWAAQQTFNSLWSPLFFGKRRARV